MELAVIGHRLCEPLTGVGRYLEALLYQWSRVETPFHRVVVYCPREPNIAPDAIRSPVELRVVSSRLSSPLRGNLFLWENLVLPAAMDRGDLLFAPYTLPWSCSVAKVVSNLGIYESRPGDFPIGRRLRSLAGFHHAVHEARMVIANSEGTRRDLVRFYGIKSSKVKVIYPGVDEPFSPALSPDGPRGDIRDRLGIPNGPFFLFVGKLSRRRNIPLLLEAFRQLTNSGNVRHSLVIVGPDPLGVDVGKHVETMLLSGRVVYFPYLDSEPLADLYRQATALVLPTMGEGFSFTVLEAMACGAPVVVFDHSALECGVREASLVVYDRDAEGLSRALSDVTHEPARLRLQQQSLDCAKQFSWRKTAQQTAAALLAALPRMGR